MPPTRAHPTTTAALLGGLAILSCGAPAPSSPPHTLPQDEPQTATVAGVEFPASWLGRWRGPASVTSAAPGRAPLEFTMELKVTPTDDPGRFGWTIIYDGTPGKQTRAYELVVKDAASGKYEIDERNGIVLASRHLDGGLYSHFLIMGNRIVTSERLLDAGGADERIEVEIVTTRESGAVRTGGKGEAADGGHGEVPVVETWLPVSVQRATLRRVAETGP